MASVQLVFRKEKTNRKGEHPLYIRITHNRKSKYVSLKTHLRPEHWDDRTLKVRKNHPNSTRLNHFLAQKVAEANEIAFKLEHAPEELRQEEVKEVLKNQDPIDFFAYFEKDLSAKQIGGKIGGYRKGKSVLKKLRAYWPRPKLPFSEINLSFLKAYELHLKEAYNNSPNTIYTDLKVIRKVYMDAVNEEIIGEEKNPFRKYKLKWQETQKPYLQEEEISRIEALDLPEDSNLFHHRNMFVFSAYVGGVRISDVLQLRWRNFTGTHLQLKIHKTGDSLSIKVPGKGLEILSWYQATGQEHEDFIFPMLKISPTETDPRAIYQALSSATAYTNKSLKEIGKQAEIPFSISFHSARHTWATRALRKGMRIEYVSKLMGHKKLKTTQVYAKIVNEELDLAMDVFE